MNATETVHLFGRYESRLAVRRPFPALADLGIPDKSGFLVVCDRNTEPYARALLARSLPARGLPSSSLPGAAAAAPSAPLHVLEPGEEAKNWLSVEAALRAAKEAGLGRDGVFIGIGGGVVTDLVAFAASVYMRGARLTLLPTPLLAMVDAAVGGKTGFDLFGVKNFVGTFRPADLVVLSTDALATLPHREWLSGLAEAVKTAVIADAGLLDLMEGKRDALLAGPAKPDTAAFLPELVRRCVAVKARIVEADPLETGAERALLNLGHTFGHALESVAGLGRLTHGEAVAWGISRACALGLSLGSLSPARAGRIVSLLDSFGYETRPMHPAALAAAGGNATAGGGAGAAAAGLLLAAMESDKKKKSGELRFVVPTETGARVMGGIGRTAVIECFTSTNKE